MATSTGNGKEFFFAQGSIGGKDLYGHPVDETHKSPYFYGKDVYNMYLSLPQTIQNEEWVLGFNGAASSVGLKFETGKATRIRLFFHGQPIYRFFGGVKEYVVSYTPLEDCTAPCAGSDCPDAITDSLTHTQALVDLINNHIELQKFGVRAQIVVDPYTASTPNMTKWELQVCDNGDAVALQSPSIGKSSWTGNELADEIENQTEHGQRLVNNLILLAVDLVTRGQETINPLK